MLNLFVSVMNTRLVKRTVNQVDLPVWFTRNAPQSAGESTEHAPSSCSDSSIYTSQRVGPLYKHKLLSEGSYSRCFCVKDAEGRRYALKAFRRTSNKPKSVIAHERSEVEVLRRLPQLSRRPRAM